MTTPRKLAFGLAFALSALLSGCHAGAGNDNNHAASSAETMGLDVVGYNHTDNSIGSFSVNGQGGSFLARHEGGGGFTCCVTLPAKYTPGLAVTVTWTDTYGEHPQSRVVAVPPFERKDAGMFAVHFLRDGQIKVFVTMYGPRHPDYPLKDDEAKM
ncbi:hypothetical protein F4827_000259 [Paraburkholderia bannensis]|uniref:DUF3304 domain-containing protein n=1 Tax=Paraburkholderia bannensis TaxID=765414 RepID=A0A7W9WNV7_9BURK|nr:MULTISPECIES: DUF3304 domain-containing protein [Paraburkholderia]MBB3255534.1 hypothetical protein [Paraburkholderia sp. WP4_3_2]MBB6100455.1 hypothetical protein [Paraburkholderia bannensis]